MPCAGPSPSPKMNRFTDSSQCGDVAVISIIAAAASTAITPPMTSTGLYDKERRATRPATIEPSRMPNNCGNNATPLSLAV